MSFKDRNACFRAALVGVLLLAFPAAAAATPVQSQDFQWRAGGLNFDAFTLTDANDDWHQWICSDGSRIAYRKNFDPWQFQRVDDAAKDTLRRIFFLSDATTGWAVGADGRFLFWDAPSQQWVLFPQIREDMDGPIGSGSGPPADLYDVHFLENGMNGWLIGTKQVWFTTNGGADWSISHVPWTTPPDFLEYYAIDVAVRPNGDLIGLICGEPGIVLKAESGPLGPLNSWLTVLDVKPLCYAGALPDCARGICGLVVQGTKPPTYEP